MSAFPPYCGVAADLADAMRRTLFQVEGSNQQIEYKQDWKEPVQLVERALSLVAEAILAQKKHPKCGMSLEPMAELGLR